jgi:hypothetical protein
MNGYNMYNIKLAVYQREIFKPNGSQCEYMYIMQNTHLKTGLQARDMKTEEYFNMAEERTA